MNSAETGLMTPLMVITITSLFFSFVKPVVLKKKVTKQPAKIAIEINLFFKNIFLSLIFKTNYSFLVGKKQPDLRKREADAIFPVIL
jgi:hypothetical protein